MTTCSLSLYPRETSCHSHQRTLAKDFSAKGILTMPPRTLVLLSGPCPASARGCPNCGCFHANPWTPFVRGLGARNTRAANRVNALIILPSIKFHPLIPIFSSYIPSDTLLLLILGSEKHCLTSSSSVDGRCLVFFFLCIPSSVRMILFPA